MLFQSIQWYWKDLCTCQYYLQDLGATFILISEDSFEFDKSLHFNSAMNLYFYLKRASAMAGSQHAHPQG